MRNRSSRPPFKGRQSESPPTWRVCKPALHVILLLSVMLGCNRKPPAPAPVVGPIQLKDVSGQVGITFVHNDGSSGERYIIEPMMLAWHCSITTATAWWISIF